MHLSVIKDMVLPPKKILCHPTGEKTLTSQSLYDVMVVQGQGNRPENQKEKTFLMNEWDVILKYVVVAIALIPWFNDLAKRKKRKKTKRLDPSTQKSQQQDAKSSIKMKVSKPSEPVE